MTLTAEVEEVSASYYPGAVHAVLRVEPTGGEKTVFRVECVCMPKCTAGERVQARFALEVPARTQQLSSYADGIALSGEYLAGMKRLGPSESFRAKTARLQRRLSAALRKGMAQGPAGVLAAMVLGDRTHLSKDLRSAYRAAGLSHVLVVSGMHVSILCGSVFAKYLPEKKKRERGYASRRRQALFNAAMALLLAGVTGLTPSVLRAATAVWVSALGVWVYGPPDALTSLGVAGVWMTLGNSYAVCDVGFELSFAAVLGTLAGAELARKGRRFPLLRNGGVGDALRFGLRQRGHFPGAGAPGVECQLVCAGVQCGRALAGGARFTIGPCHGSAWLLARAGPAAPGVLPVRGRDGRVFEPMGPLGIRLARGTDLF